MSFERQQIELENQMIDRQYSEMLMARSIQEPLEERLCGLASRVSELEQLVKELMSCKQSRTETNT